MQRRGPVIDDTKPVWRSMLTFLVPLMLSNVLQSASATLNSIFLGRLLGVGALAAASSFFPILFFLISFFVGIASASSVLIGQAYGAHDEARLKAVAGTTITLSLVSGCVLAALGVAFCPAVMRLIGTPADVFVDGVAYARVIFASLPIFFVYIAYTTFVRGTGDSRTPFLALVLSTALNFVFTPAFIEGWLGLPRLGVTSAAVAGIVANTLALGFLLVSLAREKNPLAFDGSIVRHMRLERKLLATLVRIGIPTGVQMVMVSLAEIAVISIVNRFGSSATAAYGAVNQIASYVQFPAMSIGIASSIFGAQSIGAKRFDRLRAIARAGIGLNWIIGGALITLVYCFDGAILRLFVTDAGVIATAHELLAITLWSYAIFGTSAVLSGLMRSSGTVLWPTLLSIVSIWGVELPLAYALAPRLGLPGVWIAYPVAFLAGLALQTIYYRGFWRRKRLTTLLDDRGAAPAVT
ncbi:MAG TPA: MATE family efflux transporter [Candidatus Limnocylindria bacterium]|jgi:putative MATE family efflux protein|nr:MATE family efflux transporter [Candidatus Limnocylindria bacterium]